MDALDHKKPAASAGHEVYLCHRCGWPFPNPHPSARHRRAHKRICGTIEGYKINAADLAISDDEHASDDDVHTPSPKVEKRNVKEPDSGRVGERSSKSEDDLFSDAATEFSESGVSPSLEDQLEVLKGAEKKIDQSTVKGDVDITQLKKLDNAAETAEQPNDHASSGQILVDHSTSVIPINDTGGEAVSVDLGNSLLSSGNQMESKGKADILVEGDNLASVSPGSKERNTSSPEVIATDRNLHDQVHKNAQTSTSTNLNAVEYMPELGGDKVYVSGVCETVVPVPVSGNNVESLVHSDHIVTPSVLGNRVSVVSSDDAEVEQKHDLSRTENANVSEEEKFDILAIKQMNQECKNKSSVETVSTGDLQNCFEPEGDQTTRHLIENVGDNDVMVNRKLCIADNEHVKVAVLEAPAILDSMQHSVDSTCILSSGGMDGVESQNDAKLSEQIDNNFSKSHQGFEVGNVPDVLYSVGSVGLSPRLNHDTDDVAEVYRVNADAIVTESNLKGDLESSDKRPEGQTPKDLASISPKSVVLAEHCAIDNHHPNSLDVGTEPVHSSNLVIEPEQNHDAMALPEICSVPTLKVEETAPIHEKCSNEVDPEEKHTTQYVCTLGSVEEPISDDNAALNQSPKILVDEALHDKKLYDVDKASCVGSESLQDKDNDKIIKEKDTVAPLSCGSSRVTDNLDVKWGSVSVAETNSLSSPKAETNMQNSSKTAGEGHRSKSDDFEPPSFMTLVQSEAEVDAAATPASTEIEKALNNQHPKSASLQAGWFPSLSHVVNESQGRKKNEEMIAKVTNWSMGKEHHNQLKNLMNDAKPPSIPDIDKKVQTSQKDNGVCLTPASSVLESDMPKDKPSHAEDWNSPARYPTVIKREKKKGKTYWVPFVCCSSANRDL